MSSTHLTSRRATRIARSQALQARRHKTAGPGLFSTFLAALAGALIALALAAMIGGKAAIPAAHAAAGSASTAQVLPISYSTPLSTAHAASTAGTERPLSVKAGPCAVAFNPDDGWVELAPGGNERDAHADSGSRDSTVRIGGGLIDVAVDLTPEAHSDCKNHRHGKDRKDRKDDQAKHCPCGPDTRSERWDRWDGPGRPSAYPSGQLPPAGYPSDDRGSMYCRYISPGEQAPRGATLCVESDPRGGSYANPWDR